MTHAPSTKQSHVAALVGRLVLGGYLMVHGAQKMFGVLEGPGLDNAGKGFESMGLKPGKAMATLAAGSELGGGLLTATGVAFPLGPVAITGAMTVASAVHRKAGPLSAKGGYELPLTNLALAAVLAGTGPGALRLGPRLSKKLTLVTLLGTVALTSLSMYQLLTHKPPAAPDDAAPAETPTDAEILAEDPTAEDASAGNTTDA